MGESLPFYVYNADGSRTLISDEEAKKLFPEMGPPPKPPVPPVPSIVPPYIPPITPPSPPPVIESPKCFIATAAYGTPMAKEINVLRSFRDRELMSNTLGRALVAGYYFSSPPVAHLISKMNPLRTITRGILKPIISALEN